MDQREITDRLRRIETRLVKYMEWKGFDTEVQRPTFQDGKLDVPTDAISLRDCLKAIPQEWERPVQLMHKGTLLATLSKQ